MPEPHSPLAYALHEPAYPTDDARAPGVRLEAPPLAGCVQLLGWGPGYPAALAALARHCGLEPPDDGRRAALDEHHRLLLTAPDRALLYALERFEAPPEPEADAALVDLGQTRTLLRLRGPRAPELLAKGMALDLRAWRFPTDSVARTRLARFDVLLLARARDPEPDYELLVGRSYALDCHGWLLAAGAEFGIATTPP